MPVMGEWLSQPLVAVSGLENSGSESYERILDPLHQRLLARCDGESLGEINVLLLSKQETIFGPMQIAARINQDQTISKDLTLWNQQGSQVLRGQTLVLPVDDTFRAIDIIESGRYPFAKMHTYSLPLEQAEDAIHALAGQIPGVNPVHLAIVPGAPRVALGQVSRGS